jgi:hypothetical protein
MNDNLWHVESMARMRRERIQEEMRRIRLEESALKASAAPAGFAVRLWTALQRWSAKPVERPSLKRRYEPLTPANAKRSS